MTGGGGRDSAGGEGWGGGDFGEGVENQNGSGRDRQEGTAIYCDRSVRRRAPHDAR